MLDLIDRLPRDTYYWQVITQDPEHAEMLVKAQERAEREGKQQSSAPPMATWSAEVEALHTVIDKVAGLGYIMRAVNGDKEAKPPKPMPRPETAMPTIKRRHRKEQHDKLAARLLGR
jgi:hypothetical protein